MAQGCSRVERGEELTEVPLDIAALSRTKTVDTGDSVDIREDRVAK